MTAMIHPPTKSKQLGTVEQWAAQRYLMPKANVRAVLAKIAAAPDHPPGKSIYLEHGKTYTIGRDELLKQRADDDDDLIDPYGDGAGVIDGYNVANGVAMIPVVGVLTKYATWWDDWMGFVPATLLIQTISKALSDWTVRSIVLVCDTPGGLVAGVNQAADFIAKVNGDAPGQKPIDMVVSDLCASGGYMLASQCRNVYANRFAEIGSIGVYCVLADTSDAWKSMGVNFTVVSSGGVKGLGADGSVSQELINDEQRSIDATYALFVDMVAKGRGIAPAKAKEFADGRVWHAAEALEMGLIDQVIGVDDAIAAITSKEPQQMSTEQSQAKAYIAANPDDPSVKAVRDSGFAAGKTAGQSEARQIEIDRMKSIEAACPGRPALAIKQFVAGGTADTAKLIVSELDAEKQAAADANSKAATDLATANAEIERLKADKGTQPPIQVKATAGVQPPAQGGDDAVDASSPEGKAKAEWSKMTAVQKAEWKDEKSFVTIRKLEAEGKLSAAGKALI